MHTHKYSGTAALFACAMGLSQSAWAQESETSSGGLDEIIVTATKRSENIQTVPIAVTGFSSDDLESQNISSTDDLRSRVPGLEISSFNSGITNFSIRGLGNGGNRSASVDGAVGVFLNEVYLSRSWLVNTDFVDIDRIEVLRGPQGTLFGRNTVGGAISFFSSKPTEETRLKGELSYGNYDQISMSGMISGPIGEKVFAKVSATMRSHDGYNFNTTTQNDIEDLRFAGVSGALRFTPTDTLDIQLNLDSSRRRGTGDWWILYKEGPLVGRAYADPRRGNGYRDDGFGDIDNTGGSLNINLDTDFGTFTSITSYREGTLASRTNSTGTNPAELTDPPEVKARLSNILFIQEDRFDGHQQSQELRFASPDDGRFKWIAGLYYFQEKQNHTRITDFRFIAFNSQGSGRFDAVGKTTGYAAFGNATLELFDDFNIQAGVRWSRDEKSQVQSASGVSYNRPYTIGGVRAPNGFTAQGKASWEAFTPAITVNYQPTRDVFLYATASRGFKSGGFNDTQTEKLDAETPFNPEYVWNYELGLKSEWFDRHLRFNLAAFHLDYTDLQVAIVLPAGNGLPPINVTGNAGKTYNRGIELEVEALPLPGLNVFGNYSYSDSKIKSLVVANISQAGNELARVPHHKLLAGATYTQEIGSYSLTARGSYGYTSSFFGNTNNNVLERVPPQENIDAGINFGPTDGPWSVELWGKNLSDNLNITSLTLVSGSVYGHLGTPRTYGVTLRFKN